MKSKISITFNKILIEKTGDEIRKLDQSEIVNSQNEMTERNLFAEVKKSEMRRRYLQVIES